MDPLFGRPLVSNLNGLREEPMSSAAKEIVQKAKAALPYNTQPAKSILEMVPELIGLDNPVTDLFDAYVAKQSRTKSLLYHQASRFLCSCEIPEKFLAARISKALEVKRHMLLSASHELVLVDRIVSETVDFQTNQEFLEMAMVYKDQIMRKVLGDKDYNFYVKAMELELPVISWQAILNTRESNLDVFVAKIRQEMLVCLNISLSLDDDI